MTCKCQKLPEIPQGTRKLLFTFPDEMFVEKFSNFLNSFNHTSNVQDDLLTVITQNSTQLLRQICEHPDFTQLELEATHAVILQVDEEINLGILNKFKPLRRWAGLLEAEDLLYVLKNRALNILFQPLVDLASHQIYGYECLMRGVREDGTLIAPTVLLEQAKQADLLFNLDRLAREMALHRAVEVGLQGRISINFLPTAIYNPEMCLRDTVSWVQKLGINPERIMFEVVETESVKDFKHLKSILNFYREKGFKTALDDVGSGYAGLNSLAELLPDLIKIDRTLIQNIEQLPIKQSIVTALLSIARANNIEVLAEGVETTAERDYLIAQGIYKMQGYLFGKPNSQPQTTL